MPNWRMRSGRNPNVLSSGTDGADTTRASQPSGAWCALVATIDIGVVAHRRSDPGCRILCRGHEHAGSALASSAGRGVGGDLSELSRERRALGQTLRERFQFCLLYTSPSP